MSASAPVMSNPTSTQRIVRQLTRPTEVDVTVLASVQDYPCVSVLLNTRPSSRMTAEDRSRLESLIRQVRARLVMEGVDPSGRIHEQLVWAAAILADSPTDRSVALFASSSMVEYRHLAVSVDERQIIDPTFATRDLVRSLQESPDYMLLVLDSDSARLFRSSSGALRERTDGLFPVVRESAEETGQRRRPGRRRGAKAGRRDNREREQSLAFQRQVDRALEKEMSQGPVPVIVMAGDRVLSDFLSVTSSSGRVIGFARNAGGRLDLRRLERTVRPLLSDHLADLEAAARDTMDAGIPGRGVVTGLAACWHAALAERPELLLVEESFAIPARVSRDGMLVHPLSLAERELPGVIDDIVDDLVESVIARGGQVRFVPDGSLAGSDRVALRVAYSWRGRRRRR
ncbi:MAG: hypothetical protein V9E98_03125 [Candidatus Nanopelagicales bacterium]